MRSFLNVEYFKPAFVVFAALGIHLVEPFYSTTITVGATHLSLSIFYKSIYRQMERNITAEFFKFDMPWFDNVSDKMFQAEKKAYGLDVIAAIIETASMYMDDCIKLCNFIMPELRIVLSRQRRYYDIS